MKGGVENGLEAEEFDEFERFLELTSQPLEIPVLSDRITGEASAGKVSRIFAIMRGRYRDSPPRSVEMRLISCVK